MFYSHTFLARKGPLGTVWCAAHLQHKLKKSHYISTNVEKTVKLIMFPEVPIALRMSGHLLLGVVRIYSKQVDYLYEDCNETRITINRVFTAVSVNLPNDATHAPLHSITLPEKFNLDAMELDDFDWGDDSHLKDKDEITLTEQIPTGRNPYVEIRFDHHDIRSSPIVEDDSGSGTVPMDEDVPPFEAEKGGPDFEYPSPSNRKGPGNENAGSITPQNPPVGSAEHARDARHDFDFSNNSPTLPSRAEPDKELEEQIIKHIEMNTPASKEPQSLPDIHEELRPSAHVGSPVHPSGGQSFKMDDVPFHNVVHPSPEAEIIPSPAEQPRPRRNRKRRLYDESTVLTNKFMKDALNNTSNIRRVKRNCPLSSLAIWKQNNRERLRKEGFFVEPFITGICTDLQDLYKEDSVKHHLVATAAPHQETNEVQHNEVQPPSPEKLLAEEYPSPEKFIPGPTTDAPSQCFTPGNSNNENMQREHIEMTEEISHREYGPSGNHDSGIRTPDAFYGKDMDAEGGDFSDIPELVASPGELGFLEQDDNSPARSQDTPATGDFSKNQRTMEMSSRTRAVAQYLEKQSVTPNLGNNSEGSEELSLNKILEGKTRKVCARMFYETLVLKSHGLVDAKQEHPYGDIMLKVTPKLSKGKFPA